MICVFSFNLKRAVKIVLSCKKKNMIKVDAHGAVGIINYLNFSWKYWIKREAKEER